MAEKAFTPIAIKPDITKIPRRKLDPELKAIGEIILLLAELEEPSRRRVAEYLKERFLTGHPSENVKPKE
jgi:hypothetical protein